MSSEGLTPYGFLHNSKLPSNEAIVAHCSSLEFPRGTTLVDNPSTKSIIAWVKCGHNVTIDEARTQDWTAKALIDAGVLDVQAPRVFHAFEDKLDGYGPIGFIVMEYIEGVDCRLKDVGLIAKAVQTLISLQAPPGSSLGHVGGGTRSIVHTFFIEWVSSAEYRSDQDFYDHIQNMCRLVGVASQGDLSSYDRFLCPSDFHASNFRKRTIRDSDGEESTVVVALDFYATCFMPLPFIEVALKKAWDFMSQHLTRKVKYTPTKDAEALLTASDRLVQYGFGAVALPANVHPRKFGSR